MKKLLQVLMAIILVMPIIFYCTSEVDSFKFNKSVQKSLLQQIKKW